MDVSYTVEKCALELTLYYLRNSYPFQTASIQFTNYTYVLGEALLNISRTFNVEFEYLIEQRYLEFRSSNDFPGEVLPICMKIAEDSATLGTMAGCAFLLKVIQFIHVNRKCYKFTDVARKCLILYMNRKWDIIFKERETSDHFFIYCKMINAKFEFESSSKESIDILCSDERKESLLRIIHDCYKYFELLDVTQEEFTRLSSESFQNQDIKDSEETFRLCSLCCCNCEALVRNTMRLHPAITINTIRDIGNDNGYLLRTGTATNPVILS